MKGLIGSLTANNLFDKTVIQVATEMGRDPRKDLSGCDHGWQGASSTIWSGALPDQVQIVGKHLVRRQSRQNEGSWGIGAPTVQRGSATTPVWPDDVLATLATLLKVEHDSNTAVSLIDRNSKEALSDFAFGIVG